MEPNACQALCAIGCQVGDTIGALLALALFSLVTSGLAVRERWKRKKESDRRARAELEAQQQAMQAAQAAAQAEYWREQSMRPAPMPRDATQVLELEVFGPVRAPSERPGEFTDEPTDPGIRKRP
jgi:hypothetical protein